VPQALQFPGSLLVSTHALEQFVRPVVQLVVQPPTEHTCELVHAVEHVPQFAGSVERSTHAPLGHRVSPAFAQSAVPPASVSLLRASAASAASLAVSSPPEVSSPPSVSRAASASSPLASTKASGKASPSSGRANVEFPHPTSAEAKRNDAKRDGSLRMKPLGEVNEREAPSVHRLAYASC
jgi:hypothetical protein